MIIKNWILSSSIVLIMILCIAPFVAANDVPVADAGGPYSGTSGESIDFDASGSYDPDGTVVQYDWKWSDTGAWKVDIGPTPSHTYSPVSDHTYTVTVRVTDNEGATGTDTVTVPVAVTDNGYDGTAVHRSIDSSSPPKNF